MIKLAYFPVLLLLPLGVLAQEAPKKVLTLRSLGAIGDGKTDDREAIQRALQENGDATIDGENLAYAVKGNISTESVNVDFRNATLLQMRGGAVDTTKYFPSVRRKMIKPDVRPKSEYQGMIKGIPLISAFGTATYKGDPPASGDDLVEILAMLNIRTLNIHGSSSMAAVRLENINILRGNHPDAGMHSNSAAIYVERAKPLILNQIDISGDGKGGGLMISVCEQVRVNNVKIHDMRWSPYPGDDLIPLESIKEDFAWNNNPIYDFDEAMKQFVRVRIQEQMTGMTVTRCSDVEITNMHIWNLNALIGGGCLPWQIDGMTIGELKNLTIRDCTVSGVWEGIDLTGKGVDGFVEENIHMTDIFAYAFKYAHPQKNGKVINCVAERAGLAGFVIGSEAENLQFINCKAIETGSNGYWTRKNGDRLGGIAGFAMQADDKLQPHDILIKDCESTNHKYPAMMDYAFMCDPQAANVKLNNHLVSPKSAGGKKGSIANLKR